MTLMMTFPDFCSVVPECVMQEVIISKEKNDKKENKRNDMLR